MVNRFGEAMSEARRAMVGGAKDRQWGGVIVVGAAPPARRSGGALSSPSGVRGGAPAAKGFSRILNTQDDLSGQQDYGPRRFYFFASWPSGRARIVSLSMTLSDQSFKDAVVLKGEYLQSDAFYRHSYYIGR